MKKWYLSLFLLVSYVGIFNLWIYLNRALIAVSGISICIGLCLLIFIANKQKYFKNPFDLFLHLIVVLDIFLEAILPIDHDHHYFYWCAAAFAVVLGGYRAYLVHGQQENLTKKKNHL